MSVRRVRVDEWRAAGVALVAGLAVAALSDARPTADAWSDAVVLTAAVGVVAWLAASAPWWALAGAAAIGLGGADTWWAAAFGVVGLVLALWVGSEQRNLSMWRSVAAGAAMIACSGSRWDASIGAIGWSTVIVLVVGVTLAVSGLRRRRRRVIKVTLLATAGVAVVAIAFSALTAWGALGVRTTAVDGREAIEAGLDALSDGDDIGAATAFVEAAESFAEADEAMSAWWVQPSRLVPVVAQHRAAVGELAAEATEVSELLADVSLTVDVDSLRPVEGQVDLDEVERITPPVVGARDALVSLRATIDEVSSPLLVDRVADPLDAAAEEFDERIGTVDAAVEALEVLPGMLGAQEPQRYFVAFTTPAEARGSGGFMGSYAIVTADDGLVGVTEIGRTRDLNLGLVANGPAVIEAPDDWRERWGRFGMTNGPGGTAGPVAWSNITMSPHFPSTAQVMASLYPQSGGDAIDGVFALDPFVLQELVAMVDGVAVTDADGEERRLDGRNTAEFLLVDQYRFDETVERIDVLEGVAGVVVDEFLSGASPSPAVLADRLGPMVDQRRLLGWADDPQVQRFFERIDLHGALPDPAGDDGWHLVVNNAGANKIDVYLERDVTYEAEVDPTTGYVSGRLDIALTNDAPVTGFAEGIIGNYVGDPVGTNRMLVTVYTALPVVTTELDGAPWPAEAGAEAGWHTMTNYVVIPPGESRTLSVEVGGVLGIDTVAPVEGAVPLEDGYHLVVVNQPLVVDPGVDVIVAEPEGAVFSAAGTPTGVWRGPADDEGDGDGDGVGDEVEMAAGANR